MHFDNEQWQAVVEQNPRQNVKKMFQTLDDSTVKVSRHLQIIEKVKHSMPFVHNINDLFLHQIGTCDEK